MLKFLGQLRVVVMSCPYEALGPSSNQQLFLNALLLKLKSYQNVYPEGVLPLDTYDFVSTHHWIGMKIEGRFRPLMVFRTITAERCDFHRLAFPGLAVLRSSGAENHAAVLEKCLSEWKSRGERVSYGSGWAIDPMVRKDPELRALLKDLMTATLVNHELDLGTRQLVACGAAKVHTDRYFENIGYRRMEKDGVELPPFPQASLIGVEAVLLHTERFNDGALELADRYRDYWIRREALEAEAPARKKAA